ncbi:SusE domain-containing protein [Tenacibaculum sp. M341]|uniref:SusE domain-containing protein n=1 Tax=Tenacibaculum sp. M341 TaxID=2530339 RepID=UPI001052325D|nr:SusE domain-containing protein [Tenacibaculum sp. M341]TCI94934.1 SusF/SusE family outer membrane protein [Tenacibaculum sp. M341]
MKNIYIKISYVLVFVLAVGIIGCNDNSETFTVSSNPTTPILNNVSISDIEIDRVNVNTPGLTLNWENADYGVQSVITYDVQFSSDENFTNPVIASSVQGKNSVTLSMGELNTNAGNAGLNPFEWSNLYVRVSASLGSQNGVPTPSNTLVLNVYPFFNYVFDDYFIVGDATSPGWDNNNNNPALYRDIDNPNLFTYTGYFGSGFFKVLETKGSWTPQWGTNDGTSIEANPGGGDDPERFPDAGGTNITPGYYTFTINFGTNDFSFEAFDETGITSPGSLEVQGSSLATSVALTPLAFDGHIWYANSVRLLPGELQFLANGADAWGSDTAFSGIATVGGASIPVPVEDDYDIWFNDLTGQYILIPLNI